jgi:hypothetical protein
MNIEELPPSIQQSGAVIPKYGYLVPLNTGSSAQVIGNKRHSSRDELARIFLY